MSEAAVAVGLIRAEQQLGEAWTGGCSGQAVMRQRVNKSPQPLLRVAPPSAQESEQGMVTGWSERLWLVQTSASSCCLVNIQQLVTL